MVKQTLDGFLAELIGSKARELAERVSNIDDSNIDSIEYFHGYHYGLPYYSANDQYLILNVELKEPFKTILTESASINLAFLTSLSAFNIWQR